MTKKENDDYFGEKTNEWDWPKFLSTENFPLPKRLSDWVIGQEHAIREMRLCVDEWINKLKWLKKREWWKIFEVTESPEIRYFTVFGHKFKLWKSRKLKVNFSPKSRSKEYLPAGPFLLLIGDPGTGKSLLGRAMADYMTDTYKENGISLCDVLTWENKTIPSEPKISIHPSPQGEEIVKRIHKKESGKGRFMRLFLKSIMGLMMGFGVLILGYFIGYLGLWTWLSTPAISKIISFSSWMIEYTLITYLQPIMAGIMALSMGAMLFIFSKLFGLNGKGKKGIGGAESTKAPKLLIDNKSGITPFVDATGHGSSQLYGSIAWDPYQTGDLGTPEHQRVTAGDVHRAHLGVLYIDEIKNLTGAEAVTLLTVLEDGQLPVSLRSQFHGGDTAAMAVATEPIPCMVFLIAAGNMDSVPQIHPALMDRISGYGKIVYMNNRIPNTVENRRKYVQFISQEIKRFNLLPFSREACIAIMEESRRKSGRKDRLTCMFRQMISIIKTASTLAMDEGLSVVTEKQVNCAITEHCKSIAVQVMEKHAEEERTYQVIDSTAKPKIGQIYGLSVIEINGEFSGSVLPIRAGMELAVKDEGMFVVTGVATRHSSWVQHSIAKVKHVILQSYGVNVESDYNTHIDFAQNIGVDGPSAGVAMTLLLISLIIGKHIRQDVAVTGEINLKVDGKIMVTPIGGVHAKILAAQQLGFKKVLVPKINYDVNVNTEDYKIEVVPCDTLDDYIKEVFADDL
jgi:Lon-like ATP-dependent protease